MRERNFAYAVGRIRALETKLLDNAELERIGAGNDLADVLAKLGETDYAGVLAGLKQPQQFENALNQELHRVARLVMELSGNAPEFQVFLHRYDLQNLKVILKKPTITPGELSGLGIWEPEWLLGKLAADDFREFPPVWQHALAEAKTALNQSGDGQAVDRILDPVWFAYGLRILQTGISPLLTQWWLALIDLTNLRTFIRMRLIGMSFKDFISFLVGPGQLTPDSFAMLWEQTEEKVAAWLANTPYAPLLGDGGSALGSLSRLEREFDNYLINLIAPAKMISLGIEPLIGYWLAKENEVKVLRTILVGKVNQMANAEIKERLRRAYA
jgi:V/A-type H+-transporting ATPase subunit C